MRFSKADLNITCMLFLSFVIIINVLSAFTELLDLQTM